MYQCPACKTTFEDRPVACPNCGIQLWVMDLSPILTPVATSVRTSHDGSPLMVLTACDSQLDAEILIGRLKSEGIDAMMSGTAMEATMGTSDAGSDPYQVLIHQSDGERALRLIGSEASWTEEQLNEYISRLN